MPEIFIGLGSNRGDRMQYLQDALDSIKKQIGTLIKSSSVYEAAAWGYDSEASYLNAVVKCETTLSPPEVLAQLHRIEDHAGRTRETGVRYSDRTLDLDLLYYGDRLIDEENLHIPHPRIAERQFVLQPMAEIEPEWMDVRLAKTVEQLKQMIQDPGGIEIHPTRLV